MANGEISRHSDFYIPTVTFLVEDSLFRVPKEPFQQESDVFWTMFSLPQGDGIAVEGSSDENPIRLRGTSKNDFEQLLKSLLHRKYSQQPNLPNSIEQWTSVLKLSTMWCFEKLRQASIDALAKSGIGPVDKVALSHRYHIKDWLLPALNELARRPEPITTEEAKRMGIDIALKLASIRERGAVTAQSHCHYCSYRRNENITVGSCRDPRLQNCDFSDQIRSMFSAFDL
ncbi:hypothetical protein EDC04DRAFT_1248639 [Pisolithus marmoratus]|nr:hypothetical protein EDC04DRAFT_1248639 [Pisolithus marmoratus]